MHHMQGFVRSVTFKHGCQKQPSNSYPPRPGKEVEWKARSVFRHSYIEAKEVTPGATAPFSISPFSTSSDEFPDASVHVTPPTCALYGSSWKFKMVPRSSFTYGAGCALHMDIFNILYLFHFVSRA